MRSWAQTIYVCVFISIFVGTNIGGATIEAAAVTDECNDDPSISFLKTTNASGFIHIVLANKTYSLCSLSTNDVIDEVLCRMFGFAGVEEIGEEPRKLLETMPNTPDRIFFYGICLGNESCLNQCRENDWIIIPEDDKRCIFRPVVCMEKTGQKKDYTITHHPPGGAVFVTTAPEELGVINTTSTGATLESFHQVHQDEHEREIEDTFSTTSLLIRLHSADNQSAESVTSVTSNEAAETTNDIDKPADHLPNITSERIEPSMTTETTPGDVSNAKANDKGLLTKGTIHFSLPVDLGHTESQLKTDSHVPNNLQGTTEELGKEIRTPFTSEFLSSGTTSILLANKAVSDKSEHPPTVSSLNFTALPSTKNEDHGTSMGNIEGFPFSITTFPSIDNNTAIGDLKELNTNPVGRLTSQQSTHDHRPTFPSPANSSQYQNLNTLSPFNHTNGHGYDNDNLFPSQSSPVAADFPKTEPIAATSTQSVSHSSQESLFNDTEKEKQKRLDPLGYKPVLKETKYGGVIPDEEEAPYKAPEEPNSDLSIRTNTNQDEQEQAASDVRERYRNGDKLLHLNEEKTLVLEPEIGEPLSPDQTPDKDLILNGKNTDLVRIQDVEILGGKTDDKGPSDSDKTLSISTSNPQHHNEIPRRLETTSTHSEIEVTGSGYITSANYPAPYPDGTNSTWTLRAQEHLTLELSVEDFYTEPGADVLSIYEFYLSDPRNRSLLVALQGDLRGLHYKPRTRRDANSTDRMKISSKTSGLYLEFVTDSYKSFRGFNLTYYVKTRPINIVGSVANFENPSKEQPRKTHGYVVAIGCVVGVFALVMIILLLMFWGNPKKKERKRFYLSRNNRVHPTSLANNMQDNHRCVLPDDVEMNNYINELVRSRPDATIQTIEEIARQDAYLQTNGRNEESTLPPFPPISYRARDRPSQPPPQQIPGKYLPGVESPEIEIFCTSANVAPACPIKTREVSSMKDKASNHDNTNTHIPDTALTESPKTYQSSVPESLFLTSHTCALSDDEELCQEEQPDRELEPGSTKHEERWTPFGRLKNSPLGRSSRVSPIDVCATREKGDQAWTARTQHAPASMNASSLSAGSFSMSSTSEFTPVEQIETHSLEASMSSSNYLQSTTSSMTLPCDDSSSCAATLCHSDAASEAEATVIRKPNDAPLDAIRNVIHEVLSPPSNISPDNTKTGQISPNPSTDLSDSGCMSDSHSPVSPCISQYQPIKIPTGLSNVHFFDECQETETTFTTSHSGKGSNENESVIRRINHKPSPSAIGKGEYIMKSTYSERSGHARRGKPVLTTEMAGKLTGMSLPNPHPPQEFVCPITNELMTDPVVTPGGARYERQAIIDWMKENSNWPVTGKPIRDQRIKSDFILKSRIRDWKSNKSKNRMKVRRDIRKAASEVLGLVDQ